MIFQYSQRGRVVKALVLKTDTFTFAGSSPVVVDFLFFMNLLNKYCELGKYTDKNLFKKYL